MNLQNIIISGKVRVGYEVLKIRDISNKIKYRNEAPVYGERIWVAARECKEIFKFKDYTDTADRTSSGKVVSFQWPNNTPYIYPVKNSIKIASCIDHWEKGIPWDNTPIYDHMLEEINKSVNKEMDGCRNLKEIKQRYEKLDIVFNKIKNQKKFNTQEEISPKAYKETGGVLIHIGPNGIPYFGCVGYHRFAMAYVLDITIPAQLGCIHYSALNTLKDYRKVSG
jgi:hypothetical protein